jgi:hypothetical protein
MCGRPVVIRIMPIIGSQFVTDAIEQQSQTIQPARLARINAFEANPTLCRSMRTDDGTYPHERIE